MRFECPRCSVFADWEVEVTYIKDIHVVLLTCNNCGVEMAISHQDIFSFMGGRKGVITPRGNNSPQIQGQQETDLEPPE